MRLLLDVITTEVNTLNAAYAEPLPASETRAIAASIHRWVITHFDGWTDSRTVNNATFMNIQSARGKRSGSVRAERSKAIREELES